MSSTGLPMDELGKVQSRQHAYNAWQWHGSLPSGAKLLRLLALPAGQVSDGSYRLAVMQPLLFLGTNAMGLSFGRLLPLLACGAQGRIQATVCDSTTDRESRRSHSIRKGSSRCAIGRLQGRILRRIGLRATTPWRTRSSLVGLKFAETFPPSCS